MKQGITKSDSIHGVSPLGSPDFSILTEMKEEQEEKQILTSPRREAAPSTSPWYDDDVPFDQVTTTFSSLTSSTLNTQSTMDILPPTPAHAPGPALMLPRKTHDFSLSNGTSSDEPVVFQRNSGSRPFDEISHDFKEISRVEESILESEEPLDIDEVPLLGKGAFLVKSDYDSTFGLALGTREAPNSPIQVFEDEDPDPSSVFQSFKDDNMHQFQEPQQQQQQQQPKLTKSQQQKTPQESQQTQTAAQKRRARRHQFQFSRNMVTSDDSSMEPDHMQSLQARAQHAYFRRNRAKTITPISADVATSVVQNKKHIKSAMVKSNRLSARRRRERKKSAVVSFDENPDMIHHYISDQVHPTFSDDNDNDSVTSGDTVNSDNSKSIESKIIGSKSLDSKGGVTEMLRDLFYFGQRRESDSVRTEEASNNAEDDSTLGDLGLKSDQPNDDNSSISNSGKSGVRDTQAVEKEAAINSENDRRKSSLTAMWGAVEGGVKAVTEAIVLNEPCLPSCAAFRSVDTKIMTLPLRGSIVALSKGNLLDQALEVETQGASTEVIPAKGLPEDQSCSTPPGAINFQTVPLGDTEEQEECSLGSLERVQDIDDASVGTATVDEDDKNNNPIETDSRLSELATYAARTIHEINGVELDEDTDAEIIAHLEFKVVRIGLPLGLLFHENGGGCWVAKIFPGSNATRSLSSDEIIVGDQLAAIDGHSAIRMKVDDICCLIAEAENIQSIELTLLRYTGPLYPKLSILDEQQEMLHENDDQDESRTDLDSYHNRETKVSISSQKSSQHEEQQKSLARSTSVSKMFRSPLKGNKKKTTKKLHDSNNKQQKDEKRFRWFGKKKKQK
eukprot:CAMPEP_0194168700 /NCGR_PEP_ID=MMETSP0154-20130528/3563_1 /TAXON_ID=1049557 /ORGANISM="Thalassiothrix antarctica, Strain L6-D1" /LENGTH=844 /DNA_ID=CAMNT_0038879887 /DNA_START=657 /DNA_END=3191 /DNA_ORIENTATION=+